MNLFNFLATLFQIFQIRFMAKLQWQDSDRRSHWLSQSRSQAVTVSLCQFVSLSPCQSASRCQKGALNLPKWQQQHQLTSNTSHFLHPGPNWFIYKRILSLAVTKHSFHILARRTKDVAQPQKLKYKVQKCLPNLLRPTEHRQKWVSV